MTYTGKVNEIIYSNEENGYTVLLFDADGDVFVAVGTFPPVSEGEMLKITGEFKDNKKYGEQFAVTEVDFVRPEDEYGIIKYLSSGLFKGIGERLAKEIVDKFGVKTLDVLENNPERLIEVSGIGKKKLMEIIICYENTRRMKETVLFLQKHDVSMNLALKIYRKYGDSTIDIMKANPYVLVADVEGVGFITADKIALKIGIPRDSEFRIRAGITNTLQEGASKGGHTCLPQEAVIEGATKLLGLEKSLVENCYCVMHDLKREEVDGQILVADSVNYHSENAIAAKLIQLNLTVRRNDVDVVKELDVFERQTGIILDVTQRAAIKSVFDNGVSVITGGPGTGKTTLIKGIVSILENRGKRAVLCAPTGRASKRMMEATGVEAKTIHRLLGMDGIGKTACYNEGTPLPCDVIIVDEISMADIYIFNALTKAVPLGARLVLVGDKDQLPSVACGNILSDVINSGIINVVFLTEVYRQSAYSMIVENAHRINRGEMPIVKNAKDFFLSTKSDVWGIRNDVLTMIKTRIPKFIDVQSSDVQVLSPVRKGELGVEVLNSLLQEELNPDGAELIYKDEKFRVGDRVMQTANNYQIEWSRRFGAERRGTGVFNGDIGKITEVGKDRLVVEYDDGRTVIYDGGALDELALAYCISVHKSQGSEFPVVILVLGKSAPMLLTRNLVYTAVTRAKKMVVIIGEESVLRYAIGNTYTAKRYSLLRHLLLKNKGKAELLWGND